MNEPFFHPSARSAIEDLRRRYPDTPFLALGQTALWDEPTKAAFRRALDVFWPEARLIAGAHDTDYFAKLPRQPTDVGDAHYALVAHDDLKTQGLWSAAGEMSVLFGGEDVPARQRIENEAGVSLHRALHGLGDADEFLSNLTEAWGWTGIVHTGSGRRIAHDVPVRDILPVLLDQIETTLQNSADCIQGERSRALTDTVRGWVETFAQNHPDAALPDLYRDLFPRFYEMLLGGPPANLSTTSTLQLLRFNRKTAHLPRFAVVDRFLRPETRKAALAAYDGAVAGSEIYTLDRFGEGALPFDLVLPGRGRGTLHVLPDGTVSVSTEKPITLCAGCSVESVADLADLVERELGPDAALVGKAVSLIAMLSAEFLVVFHEGASGYTHRTRRMIDLLAEANAPLPDLRPILRVRTSAWDALDALGERVSFRLPPHLAQGFARETLPASEFAACWQCVRSRETQRLQLLAETRSPRDLLAYLIRALPNGWEARRAEHETARVRLLAVWGRAQAIQGRIYTLYDQVQRLKAEATRLEREKGDDFRARVQPLRERIGGDADGTIGRRIDALGAERAVRFDHEIAERRTQIRYALATVRDLKAQRLALERGSEASEARRTLRRIEAEAERAKADLAANAIRVVDGLQHTNHRPSAWWFPLVDSSGAWFRRLSETAEYHLETLVEDAGE